MIFQFEDFTLDAARMELSQAGLRVQTQPQVLETLAFLLANRHHVISKQELLDNLWGGRVVSDAAISKRLELVRKAIGDNGVEQRLIRTIYGRGFRFVGSATEAKEIRAPAVIDMPVTDEGRSALAKPEVIKDWIGKRPTIAVAPLRVIGDAGGHATLAEALPADVTHAIANLPWLFVIARGSAFRLGWEDTGYAEARDQLGVQYVLAGSIEIFEEHFLCQIELVDTLSHGVLWSERYDCSLSEVHEVRRNIAGRVVAALEVEIPHNEASRLDLSTPGNLTAWQSYHAGMSLLFGRSEQPFERIHSFFDRSIELAPDFGQPWQNKSIAYLWQTLNQVEPERNADLMVEAIERAQMLDPHDPGCLATAGFVHAVNSEPERGSGYLSRALERSPNMARAYIAQGAIEAHSGDPEKAIVSADRALALSPLDPIAYVNHSSRSAAYLRMGDLDQAANEAIRVETYGHENLQASILALSALHVAGKKREADRVEEKIRTITGRVSSTRMQRQYPEIDPALAGPIFRTLMERNLQLA